MFPKFGPEISSKTGHFISENHLSNNNNNNNKGIFYSTSRLILNFHFNQRIFINRGLNAIHHIDTRLNNNFHGYNRLITRSSNCVFLKKCYFSSNVNFKDHIFEFEKRAIEEEEEKKRKMSKDEVDEYEREQKLNMKNLNNHVDHRKEYLKKFDLDEDNLVDTSKEKIEYLYEEAERLMNDAIKMIENGNYECSEVPLEASLILRKRAFKEIKARGLPYDVSKERLIVSQSELTLGYIKQTLHRNEEALEYYENSYNVVREHDPVSEQTYIHTLNYAELHYALKNYKLAISYSEDALRIIRKLCPNSEHYAMALANMAGYLCCEKRFADAKPYALQAFKIFLEKFGKYNNSTQNSWTNLYIILKELGQDDEAEELEMDWNVLHEPLTYSENLTNEQIDLLRKRIEEKLYQNQAANPNLDYRDPVVDPRYEDVVKEIYSGSIQSAEENFKKVRDASEGSYDPKKEVWSGALKQLETVHNLIGKFVGNDDANASSDTQKQTTENANDDINKRDVNREDKDKRDVNMRNEDMLDVNNEDEDDRLYDFKKGSNSKKKLKKEKISLFEMHKNKLVENIRDWDDIEEGRKELSRRDDILKEKRKKKLNEMKSQKENNNNNNNLNNNNNNLNNNNNNNLNNKENDQVSIKKINKNILSNNFKSKPIVQNSSSWLLSSKENPFNEILVKGEKSKTKDKYADSGPGGSKEYISNNNNNKHENASTNNPNASNKIDNSANRINNNNEKDKIYNSDKSSSENQFKGSKKKKAVNDTIIRTEKIGDNNEKYYEYHYICGKTEKKKKINPEKSPLLKGVISDYEAMQEITSVVPSATDNGMINSEQLYRYQKHMNSINEEFEEFCNKKDKRKVPKKTKKDQQDIDQKIRKTAQTYKEVFEITPEKYRTIMESRKDKPIDDIDIDGTEFQKIMSELNDKITKNDPKSSEKRNNF